MLEIFLSEQPIKTTVRRGENGCVCVISSRVVPEAVDERKNILKVGHMISLNDPIRRRDIHPVPTTPFSRLLYQCRSARDLNVQTINDAVHAIITQGFNAVTSIP
ncbi:hypothetical protein J8629_06235 [Serratia fonticola]|uniref:hypothetical protein n=1 Tax=Serratia fonticola TaxID=47917 RepID=UPI001AEABF2A|nr:hypothetical protein [Serratia fonticola]MBP0996666.1 hypothetical protein [Serratia fonticola]